MIRGTTPTYIVTIGGIDLTDQSVFLTLSYQKIRITLQNERLRITADEEGTTIAFQLTQAETLAFPVGSVDIQARFIDSEGTALATTIGKLQVERVLNPVPITYQGGGEGG